MNFLRFPKFYTSQQSFMKHTSGNLSYDTVSQKDDTSVMSRKYRVSQSKGIDKNF